MTERVKDRCIFSRTHKKRGACRQHEVGLLRPLVQAENGPRQDSLNPPGHLGTPSLRNPRHMIVVPDAQVSITVVPPESVTEEGERGVTPALES